MNKTPPIVLIVHPGTMGDVLLAIEAIREIRKKFPSHHVVLVGQSEIGAFLFECEEVHEVMGIEGPLLSQLFTGTPQMDDHVKAMLQRCTHCVCWMTDHDEMISNTLQSLGIRYIIQSPQSSELMNVHHEERFLRTLHPWGIMADRARERMPLFHKHFTQSESDSLRSRFSFLSTPYFVIHPGSGSQHKCLDSSLLGKIAGRLLEQSGMTLVILSGPADQSQVSRFLDEIPCGNSHLLSHQSLTTVAGVLKEAALYIGHDSGISHLAAGVGTPSMVLFGPTNSAHWAPRGDHVTVIQGPTCQCVDWKQVQQCHPKPCLRYSVDLVLQKAEQLIPVNGKSHITNFKSQMNSKYQYSQFQTLEPSNSLPDSCLKFEI
jgi:ADP-heptose:LPS heptosyltransferase